MHRNVRAEFRPPASIQPPNSTWLTANRTSKIRAPSKVLGQLQDNRALAVHKRNKGATTRSPAAPPNHQVNPMAAPSVHCANPPRHRLVTPTAALTMVLSAPARAANRNTVLDRKSSLRPPANRSTNHRSEEHTSELQSPYVTSYAVFCLKTKQNGSRSARRWRCLRSGPPRLRCRRV